MASTLLATKLRVPPVPEHAVRRERLVNAIERGTGQHKLTLISAPAGYGKTTLLAQWARAANAPVVWLSLGEDDNDPERFFRYLLAGWEEVQPGIMESPPGLILGGMMPDIQAVLPAFINVASELSDRTVFILDDYHLIEEPAIHEALTFLLDNLPPAPHFVLASRAEPPLPLARYRARQEVLELGAEDLQFRIDETEQFLSLAMDLDLDPSEIEPLQGQLEGWVAGLQLAALTLRSQRTPANGLAVSGRHRFIADYLNQDVLARLPDATRRFLLQTSIADRLCGPLCDAITGDSGCQEMLEALERDNLFLMPLDDNREWFRYHRLFADFLREELHRRYPDDVAEFHRRAGHWYLAHDLPDQAFHHALAGDDLELMIEIGERYIFAKLHAGEFRTLQNWLDSLPADWYVAYPGFGLARAGFLAFTGAFEACVRCVNDVEQMLISGRAPDQQWQMSRITAMRCFMACMQNDIDRAESLASEAFQQLRDDDFAFQADTYHALGDTYRRIGRWDDAREHYLKVLDLTDSPTFRVQSAHAYGALADLDLQQGHLRGAAGYWKRALAAIHDRENWGRIPLPVSGWVYVRMGEILYEWNDLAAARKHLLRGLERSELGGDVRAMIAGNLIAGRLRLAEGDIEAATNHLEKARPLVEEARFPDWAGRFERLQLELWLAQDRLRAAVNWADRIAEDDARLETPESEVLQLAVARILIVKRDTPSVERALALLRPLLQAAESEGKVGVAIEALALQSLALWQRGDRSEAMTALERALRLAETEGYLRLFADLGLPMGRLLQEARSRDIMPDYVGRLLAAFGAGLASQVAVSRAMPEPLTDRELEILEMIAAGLTNPEIANKLVISPQTVKKHAGNIYGKLGVHSRTEAAARARELNLLR